MCVHAPEWAATPRYVKDSPPVDTPKAVPCRPIQIDKPSGLTHRVFRSARPNGVVVACGVSPSIFLERSKNVTMAVSYYKPHIHELVIQVRDVAASERPVPQCEEHRAAPQERFVVVPEPVWHVWEDAAQQPGFSAGPFEEWTRPR